MNVMNEELLDLLAERALGTLSPDDEARLNALLDAAGIEHSEDIELAVAAAMNAFAGDEKPSGHAPIPDGLQDKLRADADRFFDAHSKAAPVADLDAARARRAAQSGPAATTAPASGLRGTGLLGWAVAATLAVVVIFAFRPEQISETPDLAIARAALIASAETSVIDWGRSEIPAYNSVTGDVVWNDKLQQGYLRLTGMPANDPDISQYQLWIVDPDRDANPVDGGVFDIPTGTDEIIIPIQAKLDVSNPVAFAITREQPGGVVVSDGPLLVVAAAIAAT